MTCSTKNKNRTEGNWKSQYTIKECRLQFYRICPIRIEIIYGRVKFVGDFDMGNIICANFSIPQFSLNIRMQDNFSTFFSNKYCCGILIVDKTGIIMKKSLMSSIFSQIYFKHIRLFRIISIPSIFFLYFRLPDHVILMKC